MRAPLGVPGSPGSWSDGTAETCLALSCRSFRVISEAAGQLVAVSFAFQEGTSR